MDAAPRALSPLWDSERLRGAPVHLFALLLAVESIAVGSCLTAVFRMHVRLDQWRDFAILLVSCVVFEEISRQVGKLRLMVRTGPLADMTSVWMFAGVLLLPAGLAGALAASVAAVHWLCQKRGAGQYLYRFIYTAATVVLACLLSSATFSAVSGLDPMPAALQHLLVFG